jgi:hypothetical protein
MKNPIEKPCRRQTGTVEYCQEFLDLSGFVAHDTKLRSIGR